MKYTYLFIYFLVTVRVELVKEIDVVKEEHQKELEAKDTQHKTELKEIRLANREQIQ